MKRIFVMGGFLALISSAPALAQDLKTLRILALSPIEARAVVMDVEGAVLTLAPGDLLLEGQYKVRQVLSDRLVLEGASAPQTVSWLFKPTAEKSEPRVLHFASEPDEELVLNTTNSSVELGSNLAQ